MKTLILIGSQIAWKQLYKLKYEYKILRKDIFVNRHKQSNIMSNSKNFLINIKKLKLYMMGFKKDDIIRPNTYFFNYVITKNERQANIVITHDKYIFYINNRVPRA